MGESRTTQTTEFTSRVSTSFCGAKAAASTFSDPMTSQKLPFLKKRIKHGENMFRPGPCCSCAASMFAGGCGLHGTRLTSMERRSPCAPTILIAPLALARPRRSPSRSVFPSTSPREKERRSPEKSVCLSVPALKTNREGRPKGISASLFPLVVRRSIVTPSSSNLAKTNWTRRVASFEGYVRSGGALWRGCRPASARITSSSHSFTYIHDFWRESSTTRSGIWECLISITWTQLYDHRKECDDLKTQSRKKM